MRYCVLSRLGDVQTLSFLDGHFQLCLRLCLGTAQNVFVDGLAGLRVVPCGVPALPSAIFSFSDVGIVKKTAHPTCPVMPPVLVLTATVSA